MELLGRFLAVSRLNYPTPAKSLQTPQKNETPRKRGVRQQSETSFGRFFCACRAAAWRKEISRNLFGVNQILRFLSHLLDGIIAPSKARS
ncbi:MAG: hypothetical protein VYD45_04520, partial [Pseudomonadota bacterium]|nr:hypothetical protein [Pseudomonadota bacterium]